jgi:hypothetical protein
MQLTFSMKNCEFPYTTLGLCVFLCLLMRSRKENLPQQEEHVPTSISHETQLLDLEATLPPSPTNHNFYEKLPVSLHNPPDFELFSVPFRKIERKNCGNKKNMHTRVLLMKANRLIHEQLSIKLWPITLSMKNCQFPYTTYRTLGIFTDTCVEVKRGNKINM